MASESRLTLVLDLKDKLSGPLNQVAKDVDNLGNKFSSGAKNAKVLAAGFAGVTAAAAALAVGIGVKAVKAATEFETAMTNVATLISGDSTQAIADLDAGIKELLKTVPKTADELGASAYSIVSAGISDTSDALLVLEQSAILATAGLGTTEEATDIMTSALNAFGKDAGSAASVADVLFKTVKNGKTDISQLAQAFGATAPVIAAAGITLEDFSAATAALTTTGLPASQAQNALRASIVALQKPTKEMTALYNELGVTSFEMLLEQGQTLGGVFNMLSDAADGNTETMARAFGSVEALNAVIGLTDTTSQAYIDTLDDMELQANAIKEAFDKQKATFSSQFQILKNQLSVVLINLGQKILPIVTKAVELLSKGIDFMTKHWKVVKPILIVVAAGIAALGAAIAVALLPALIAMAAPLIGAAVALGGIIAAAAPFVAAIMGIVAAVMAVIAVIKNWQVILEFLKQLWTDLKTSVGGFFTFVLEKVSSILEPFRAAFEAVASVVQSVFEGIANFFRTIFAIYLAIMFAFLDWLVPGWSDKLVAMFEKIKMIFEQVKLFFETWFMLIKLAFQLALDFIKNLWETTWSGVSEFFLGIWEKITTKAQEMFNKFTSLVNKFVTPVLEAFKALGQGIKNVFSGAWDALTGGLKTAMNWVINKLNGFISKYNNTIGKLSKLPFVPNLTLSPITPLATGGIVTAPTQALIGEAGPEAVIPLKKLPGLLGGTTVNVTVNTGSVNSQLDMAEMAEMVGNTIIQKLQLNMRID